MGGVPREPVGQEIVGESSVGVPTSTSTFWQRSTAEA